jgi:hypothetical protein
MLAEAQYNAYTFDQKFANSWAHFGILMGYNRSEFRIKKNDRILNSDSLATANTMRGPGFNLGIVSNLHLGRHWDLRFLPTMTFAERNITYDSYLDTSFRQTIESINLDIPLIFKFKSEPYKDMRLYVLGGLKYSFDLASNAESRNAEDIVKIGRHNLSAEYGAGIEIYFPYFILAPEIRISQGLLDVHSLDRNLNFSNIIDKLLTRSVVIVFNFEG